MQAQQFFSARTSPSAKQCKQRGPDYIDGRIAWVEYDRTPPQQLVGIVHNGTLWCTLVFGCDDWRDRRRGGSQPDSGSVTSAPRICEVNNSTRFLWKCVSDLDYVGLQLYFNRVYCTGVTKTIKEHARNSNLHNSIKGRDIVARAIHFGLLLIWEKNLVYLHILSFNIEPFRNALTVSALIGTH